MTPEAQELRRQISVVEEEIADLEQRRDDLKDELRSIVYDEFPDKLVDIGEEDELCEKSSIGVCVWEYQELGGYRCLYCGGKTAR